MNAARRENIRLAQALLSQALDLITAAGDEEQEYLDCMPEAFQNGERGEKATAAIECLESAKDAIDGIDLDDALA